MEDKGLLEIVQRLVVDEEYRTWFMASPKEALISELEISPSAYESVMAALPIVLAGGLIIAGARGGPHGGAPDADWGRRR